MTAFFARMPKNPIGGAVPNGDFALLMMLSLNLLVLVFFMLLNSMAVPGAPNPDSAIDKAREVRAEATTGAVEGLDVPTAPLAAWRESVVTRLRGTILNRLDLRVLPQGANADELLVEVPFDEVFRPTGELLRPEFVHKLAAAGPESMVSWSLITPEEYGARAAMAMATLSRITRSPVAWQAGERRVVQVRVQPGTQTKPSVGTEMQGLSEKAGGRVTGVDAGGQE